MKTHQSFRGTISEAIQIIKTKAEIVKSHIKPRAASLTVHAETIPAMNNQIH